MGTMYDSDEPLLIPNRESVEICLGYIDGVRPWTTADWELFPHAKRVLCTRNPATDNGLVLDVEPGCTWPPSQAPGWVKMRRESKAHPLAAPAVVYCDYANWPAVIEAFNVAKVAHPNWGIACYDNLADLDVFLIGSERKGPLDKGVVFKQYKTVIDTYDESITAPNWP